MSLGEQTMKVNKLARVRRHMKTFSRVSLMGKNAFSLLGPFSKIKSVGKFWSFMRSTKLFLFNLLPAAPKNRLLFQAAGVALLAVVGTAFGTTGTFVATSNHIYSNDYLASYATPGDILVSDEHGYLVKINPQTGDSNRVGLTDYAVHTVESGESLSVIGDRYGVKVATIMWENNLSNAHSIRVGQKLVVPPVDGLSYKVNSGDSLEKIASKYDITVDAIVAQNGIADGVIQKGKVIFLPGAERIQPVVTVADARTGTTRDSRTFTAANSTASPAAGKTFIWPTIGRVTQGFHGGHYALDIADRSKPPVWAADGGTVTKASSGTWGGGYGNHVIVDHGDGLQTLYAHLDTVSVYEGQLIGQGGVLGQMGNTGRVYGQTGIHLHWEVIYNGVKQNPWNYY